MGVVSLYFNCEPGDLESASVHEYDLWKTSAGQPRQLHESCLIGLHTFCFAALVCQWHTPELSVIVLEHMPTCSFHMPLFTVHLYAGHGADTVRCLNR